MLNGFIVVFLSLLERTIVLADLQTGSDDERAARMGGWQRCLLLVRAAIHAPAAESKATFVRVLYSALVPCLYRWHPN